MIEFSDIESRLFGVKIGRINILSPSTLSLFEREINTADYDFIRVKIRNPNSKEIQHLHKICKSLHLLEIVRVYEFIVSENKDIKFSFGEYSYKEVTSDSFDDLACLVKETYEDIPFGTYTPPQLLAKFPLKIQLDSFIEFYKGKMSDTGSGFKGHIIYNKKNKKIGCILTTIEGHSSYTYYVGIIKEFRNNKILTKTINFIHNFIITNNLDLGLGAARLTNIYSQRAFENNNMNLVGYDYVYMMEF